MNHYEVLEVSPNASPEVIKAAYKSLMQRYHPDRNPGNAGAAERTTMVGRAYEVLSDPGRRVPYDAELKRLSEYLSGRQENAKQIRHRRAPVDSYSGIYLYLWLTLALIILFGWLILSPSKTQIASDSSPKGGRPAVEGKPFTGQQLQDGVQRLDEILTGNADLPKKDVRDSAQRVGARTIPIYISNLKANLRDSDATGTQHVLSIPKLGVLVGTFDAEKFIRHLEGNSEFISQKLAEKLADAKYGELIKASGPDYLKDFILNSIGQITGTNRFEDYPAPHADGPAHYGVVAVSFPESYSVR